MEIALLDKISNQPTSKEGTNIAKGLISFGIFLIVLGEMLIVLNIGVIKPYVFLLFWYGYILLIDGINHTIRKRSLIIDQPKHFLVALIISVTFWWIYEIYNSYIFQAWHYVLPYAPEWRKFILMRIAWATVLPGILETSELVEIFYTRIFGKRINTQPSINPTNRHKLFLIGVMIVGFLLLVLPWTGIYPYVLRLPNNIVLILSFLFWGAFAMFLEPVLYLYSKPSLIKEVEHRQFDKIIILLISGYICGFLWEFWNAWAGAKWIYKISFLPDKIKIFEMPIRGFLDFGPFAISMYVLYCLFKAPMDLKEKG